MGEMEAGVEMPSKRTQTETCVGNRDNKRVSETGKKGIGKEGKTGP